MNMRKILCLFSLMWLTLLPTMAQMFAPQDLACEEERRRMDYPYYYCDCWFNSQQYDFPLKTQITDTVWFTATVSQLKQGLSAYWFSNSSVTIEVYAFCASKEPTISLTVGPNQMREMDVAKINSKLDEMPNVDVISTLTPRIRVYPNNGGSGTVYCYPYDAGPRSTCSQSLPMLPRMTFVCDTTNSVYELRPSYISSNGKGFIHWKQKRNLPCTITLHADSCDGAVLAQRSLSDSTRVFMLDDAMMRQMKNAGRSIFVEVEHADGFTGRVVYYNTIQTETFEADTTICQGQMIELPDTVLMETTIYRDTLWRAADTLSFSIFNLIVDTPVVQYDTLLLKSKDLPKIYRNQERIAKDGWGDYDFTIHYTDACDEHWKVHVEHLISRETQTVDTTLCEGRTYSIGGQTYKTETQITDSLWKDADTWLVRDITIHFTAPEMEYDTIMLTQKQISGDGFYYSVANTVITEFGDYEYEIKVKNQCTRLLTLTVLEELETGLIDETQRAPKADIYLDEQGVLYIRRDDQIFTILGNRIK